MYCYLIRYQAKHLLPFHNTNNKLNKFYINTINWKWVTKFEDINIKNHICYFFDYIVNIKDLQPLTTTHNYPQPPKTIHNHPQPPTILHNHPQPPTFIHNHNKKYILIFAVKVFSFVLLNTAAIFCFLTLYKIKEPVREVL